MKASVNRDTCIGCGLCAATCPEVFEMQGAVAVVIADPVPEEVEATCLEASDGCPVTAISLQEAESGS